MDHNDAIRLRAAERYTLGELPADQRDAYEEHFFDCAECAMDIQAMSAFADGARAVFGDEAKNARRQESLEQLKEPPGDRGSDAGRNWWTGWLQPLVAVPVFAVLLLVIGYQNLRTIPELKSGSGASMQALNSFSLAAANSRGSAAVRIMVHRGENFLVNFDIPPGKGFSQYLCQLRDESGRVLRQVSVSAEQANKSVELLVPASIMRSGSYSVVIAGDTNPAGPFRDQNEVERLGFEVVVEN